MVHKMTLSIESGKAFQALQQHFDSKMSKADMRQFFAEDPDRAKRFSCQYDGFFLDYSKNIITTETMSLLREFAEERQFSKERERLFSGEKLNATEGRSVLHMAIRADAEDIFMHDGQNVMPSVLSERERCFEFAEKIRCGELRGHTGKVIRKVINIGIGGSDLGPRFLVRALKEFRAPHLSFYFVSNIDPYDITEILSACDPEETLFIVASKTFTTFETLKNAILAKDWLVAGVGGDKKAIESHFVAVSAAVEKAKEFGIGAERIFGFWDYVGGRFSSWSSIGLSLMIAIGADHFRAFLKGGREMDQHFRTAPLEQNMPLLMALLSFWYVAFFGASAMAVLPYDQRLEFFVNYLQQLMMESNGKSASRDGELVTYPTSPVVFGQVGTNGQHAFFQMLHQGSHFIPLEFLGIVQAAHDYQDHHEALLVNLIAQSEAFLLGSDGKKISDDFPAHLYFEGNKPSNVLLIDRLTPYSMGSLLALYEHRVFCEGVFWNINSFDQFGVELGKKLALTIFEDIESQEFTRHDSSTARLMQKIQSID